MKRYHPEVGERFYGASCVDMTEDETGEWVRFEDYAQEIATLRNELTAARVERSNLQDIDLAPIKRTQANLWQLKYFEALHALQAANKGVQRLRRRLDEAYRRLTRAGRPLEEREAPHCPTCSCGLTEHPKADGA